MSQELSNILNVIRACATGDLQARQRFQEEYGEDSQCTSREAGGLLGCAVSKRAMIS